MGKPAVDHDDRGRRSVAGAFTAIGQSDPGEFFGQLNFSLWGTFVATVSIERSFDGGATYLPVTNEYGVAYSWSAPMSIVVDEPESGVLYRLNCTAYTSGTINYRVSQ
jgi:hypothetical protein